MKSRRWIIRIAIFAITFLAFARLTTCNFTFWDDGETIAENPKLNPPTWQTLRFYWTTAGEQETMALYVPVTYTVWSALPSVAHHPEPDSQGMHLDARVFHTTNVTLHSITAVFAFELLYLLIPLEIPAVIGALIFALHPVQVEPVGWASGTKDLLCGFFAVTSLLLYVRSVQLNATGARRWAWRWRYLLGMLLFVLGMLSKPTAVVLPLMAAAISVLLLRRSNWKTTVSLLPWIALMVPCVIWTQKVQPPSWVSPLPAWATPLVAADALAFYVYKLLWPIHLCIDYGRNPEAVAASHQLYFTWIVPAVIAAVLLLRGRRAKPAVCAAVLFVLPLAPHVGFVPFEFQEISTTADHYLYLPMLGVALLVAWSLSQEVRQNEIARSPVVVVMIAIIALYVIRDHFQERTWQDTRSLFANVMSLNSRSIPAYDGMGYLAGRDARAMQKAGHPDQARKLFDESIEYYKHSLVITPGSVPSMYNLALIYKATGQKQLGLELAHRIIDEQPHLPPLLRADAATVAHLLDDFGDIPGEIDWLQQAMQRDPGNPRLEKLWQDAVSRLKSPATAR